MRKSSEMPPSANQPNGAQLGDEQLLSGLASGSEKALTQLYKRFFPIILHLVLTNSGTEEEAKDIYQDTLIILYEKVNNNTLTLHCQLKTYLYSVSRRLWLKQLSQRSRTSPADTIHLLENTESVISVEDELSEHAIRDHQFELIANSLSQLGEPCRTLLEDFYIYHRSMQEIADKFGYTNTDNAKTQKYKCLMRLKRLFFSMYKEE